MVAFLGEKLDLLQSPPGRRLLCYAPGYCRHVAVEMQCCIFCRRSVGMEVCPDCCTVAFEGETECDWLREEGVA